jgi:hypothetical protein
MLDFEQMKKFEVEKFMGVLTLYYDLEIGNYVEPERIVEAIDELQNSIDYLHSKLK